MKQTNHLTLKLFLITLLFTFISCEDKVDFSVLPGETQSGNNTFGCRVDGKIFIGNIYTTWQQAPLFVEYHREIDLLLISADGKFEDGKMGNMSMEIYHPKVDIPLNMDNGSFKCSYWTNHETKSQEYFALYSDFTAESELIITKFDTVNKIVSGKFSMKGSLLPYSKPSIGCFESDTIQITEGKFDLKINTIYNDLIEK